MEQSIGYGDEVIRYQVRYRESRKSTRIAIHVEPDGRVVVVVSDGVPAGHVKAAVRARARWIHNHVAAIRSRRAGIAPREYVSGESLLHLGRRYRLKVFVEPNCTAAVALRGSFVEVKVPLRQRSLVKEALLKWMREWARKVLIERLVEVASNLRWVRELPPLRFQMMKTQWGSCSPAGTLTLNPYLVRAPRECIDYVLLHELCHLKEHNHSPRFFRMLDMQMPPWQRVKVRLDGMAEAILNV